MKRKEYIKPVTAGTEMHNLSMLCVSNDPVVHNSYTEADQLVNENVWDDIW